MKDKTTTSNHLVLIDGYGLVFRAFHAVPALTRDDGIEVGAVYGFISMIMKIMAEIKTTHIAVIFDTGKKTFRNDLYPAYKAHRPPVSPNLIPQFAIVREAAIAMNLVVIEKENYEADDIIATLCKSAVESDQKVTIVSSDKDLMQLINEDVSIYNPVKSQFIGVQGVLDKFGVYPNKVTDILALIGDSSDNIPGVLGIGPKGALELISQFNSIEELYDRIDEIKNQKRRELLINNKDIAIISKKLVTLDYNVPIDFNISDLVAKHVDLNILLTFLAKQNFKSLSARVKSQFRNKIIIDKDPIKHEDNEKYSVVNNIDDIVEFCKKIEKIGYVSIFLLTEEFENECKIIAMSLSIEIDTIFIPFKFMSQITLLEDKYTIFSLKEINNILNDIINDKSILKIFHNYKKFIHTSKFIAEPMDDILSMSYSLNGTVIDNNNIDCLINHYQKKSLPGFGNYIIKKKILLSKIDLQTIANYSSSRARSIFNIHKILKADLFKYKITNLYQRLERPLSYVLYKMEKSGIKINKEKLKLMSDDFNLRINDLEKEIHLHTGFEFNIASPKQLGEVLFDKMKIPYSKKSKAGSYSTSADILENLAEKGFNIANILLSWRSLSKLKNTYIDSLIEQAGEDNRIHTNFSMASTSTGRLSSVDPNLQNIPVRSEDGNKIRSCFVAREGFKLLSADYSQIELRILAEMADIQALKDAFRNGLDIHSVTASQIFNVDATDIDSNMRRKAKAINFGIIYGISSFGLAKQLSISKIEATNYIEKYFDTYPGIQKFMEKIKDFARKNNYVETIYKRKCFVHGINDSNHMIRSIAERAAINAPIQGTAADIIKAAMIRISNIIKNNVDAEMLLQVHDELIFEVKESDVDKLTKIVKYEMQNVRNSHINLVVDVAVGNNWAEI